CAPVSPTVPVLGAEERDKGLTPAEEQRHPDFFLMMGTIRGSAIVLVLVLSARGRAEIQQPVSAEALEGAELNLTCSHPSASGDNIFWYRQFPNRGPEFIVTGFSGTAHSPDPEGTLHISKDKENSTFALRRLRLADAAVYYCARRDTV
ncbi:unnamed protein product, partial [Eretmochelys imbricata]